MPEEPRDIPKTICFVPVDGLVVLAERLLEAIEPNAIQSAEALSDEPVECRVRPLLRATLDDHLAELNLWETVSLDRHIQTLDAENLPPDLL